MKRNHEPEDPTLEAFRFLNHEMRPEEAKSYQAELPDNPVKFDALTSALATRAMLDAISGGRPEPDPELCAQFRTHFRFFVDGALSPPQRRDLEDHLDFCHECQEGLAKEQERARRRRARKTGKVGAGAVLIGLGLLGGWLLRGSPDTPAVAEGPRAVLSDELRLELRDVVNGLRDRGQLRATAATIVTRVRIHDLLTTTLSAQGIADLKTCVQLLGRAGPQAGGAKQWMRVALIHPSVVVRREAAIWYRKVAPGWENDEEVKSLIEAARRATPLEVPTATSDSRQ